jgi:hypothetical protein
MSLSPVAGMRLWIGGVLNDKATDFVATDFNGQSWVEVDGYSQMGPLGDAAALISTTLINRGRDVHQKGSASAPPMTNVFARIPTDPGQLALIAAGVGSNKNNYAFRLDGNESGVTTVSKTYFIGLVMGTPEAGGGGNTIRNLNVNVQINSNLVPVAAVP